MMLGVGRIEKTGLKPERPFTDVTTKALQQLKRVAPPLHHDSSVTSRSKMTKYEKEFYEVFLHPQRGGGVIIS